MQDIFVYDNSTGNVRINEYGILLVREFEVLWDPKRNKCKEDPKGEKRLRAWREFKYMWLFCDWKSPYMQYLEVQKHEEALKDSGISEEEWNDPLFRAAVRKYIEIKDSSRILGYIKTAYKTLEKAKISLDNIDFEERDENNKPIWKVKDVFADIGSISKIMDTLNELELRYKRDQQSAETKGRGDESPGLDDD